MIVEGQHVSAAIRADRLNKSFGRKQALFGLALRWPAMTMRPVAHVQELTGIGMAIAEFPITLEATKDQSPAGPEGTDGRAKPGARRLALGQYRRR